MEGAYQNSRSRTSVPYSMPNSWLVTADALQNIIAQVYEPLKNAPTTNPITHVRISLAVNDRNALTIVLNGSRYDAATGQFVDALSPVVSDDPDSVVVYDRVVDVKPPSLTT